MLDYSEYKSLIDILDKSDAANTYEDLMKKETATLDTVNAVVNHYRDRRVENKQFVHMSLYEIYNLFFLEIPVLARDLKGVKDLKGAALVLMQGNRPIYLGILLVAVSLILFFIYSSK